MSDSAGNDSNDDGKVDAGESLIGGQKMTDAEADAFDQELSDFLDSYDSGVSDFTDNYNNEAYGSPLSNSGVTDYDYPSYTGRPDDAPSSFDEKFSANGGDVLTGSNTGGSAPPVPVQDGNTGKMYVGGKEVDQATYDQAVADRAAFVDLASNPTSSPEAEQAFISESLRSQGYDRNNLNTPEARQAFDNAMIDLANYESIQSRNEAAASGLTQGGPKSSEQLDLEMIMSGAVDAPKEQVMAAAELYGAGLASGKYSNVAGQDSFLQNNMNNVQMYGGNIDKIELGNAIASGFNKNTSMSGINNDTPIIGGLGGNRMNVDAQGNVTLQTGGGYLGDILGNAAIGLGSAYVGGPVGMLGSGFEVNTSMPFSDYNRFMAGDVNDPSVSYNVNNVAGAMLGNAIAPKVAQGVFNQTNNLALAQGAGMGTNKLIQEGINMANPNGSIPLGNAGKGTAQAGSATTTVQSDLGGSMDTGGSGQTAPGFDPSDSNTFNLKDGNTDAKLSNLNFGNDNTNNDNSDNNDNNELGNATTLQNMGGDVNTLQNQNSQLLNPLGDDDEGLLPQGVSLLNNIGSGFGNYLTKGKNRKYGNATFRTASRNEVNRNKRRSGLGAGIIFG